MDARAPELIHPVAAEEIPGWVATLASTFLEDPEPANAADWRTTVERDWEPGRTWGVRDQGDWVATLRTLDRSLTVPGHDGATEILGADALTAVTVAPTHRRRGLLTRMLEASLAAARERGDAVSILIAAEWPIYGRFGYAPATLGARHVLHRSRAGSAVPGELGRVRRVDRDEFLSLAPAVFETARRQRAGQVDRGGSWWDRVYGVNGYPRLDDVPHNHVIHEGDAGPDGFVAWTATRRAPLLPPRGAVSARGPHAATADAHRDLWAYLSGLDGVDEIESWGAVDDPVRWLLPDGRALVLKELSDFLWVRLLDVPAALSARRYAFAGELVLEVRDHGVGDVSGRYRLRADGPEAACEPTDAAPELTVAQTALAAAYLGGFSLRGQRLAGGVEEHAPGALQRADAMFMTALAPLNETGF
jgi:predicted acetyltransferase